MFIKPLALTALVLGLAGPAAAQEPQAAPAALYACTGGDVPGQLAPVKVSVRVDARGAVKASWATWSLGSGNTIMRAPVVQFDYPLTGEAPARWPDSLSVVAVAVMSPPPKAMSARIVLSLNGVEKVSRSWALYAKARAQVESLAHPPAGMLGAVPFYPDAANPADAGVAELLHAAGDPDARLGVQVVGDDGSILASATYAIDEPAVHAKARIAAALAQAMDKARTPTQCPKQAG
jgi:hypothetical protein